VCFDTREIRMLRDPSENPSQLQLISGETLQDNGVRQVGQNLAFNLNDQVHVAYMRFVSNSKQVAEVMQLLPLAAPAAANGGASSSYEFSPSGPELLADLLPKSVVVSLFQAFNDAAVSEHVMRMVSMKAATDNAGALGRTIRRNYNRARQARITTELTEIVSGAAALE
jgi:F-type H+-transporting ATPase subunit gamma